MSASRRVFFLAVVLLTGHLVALAVHSTIASSVIEFLLVILVVTACVQAASRAQGYARRFWRLMAVAFGLYALGQAMATYYDSVLHKSFEQYWPSDILFLFHVGPMALALFLGDDDTDSRTYRWQRWLDFLQIGIVTLSAYFFFLYLPLLLPHSRAFVDALYVEVTAWRGSLIVVAFALRAAFAKSKLVKSLFARMAVFLLLFVACEVAYDYVEVWWHVPFGTWYELLWTVPRVLMIWLAASWQPPAEPEAARKEASSDSLLLAQFAHIAFPLLVLATATRALGQQLKLAVAAVLLSFACSSLRLFLGQRTQNELLSRQKESAEALRLAEAKFRGLLESAPDPMVAVSVDGTIVLVNAQAEKSFGYRREDLLGQSMDMLVPERLREKCCAVRTAFFREPQTRAMGGSLEIFGQRKDGSEFPVEVKLSLLETADGVWGSAAIRDLTERRKLESQFRQAQKIESIGTLAGGIAHDFNNLLTVILSYSNSLSEDLPRNSKQARAAEQIQQAAERGAALTRQMLAFSRRQVFQLRVVNLNEVIRDLLKMLGRIIGEHIEIKVNLSDDLAPLKADPGQLEQVMMNLSVNARDAMPKGGKLTFETRNVVLSEQFVREHVGSSSGPHVQLTVTDTGIGMDSTTLARIFEPFFTTKEPGEGTGLGLAMVYGVVKQSGGSIWASSEPGMGTTFTIYLPQAQGPVDSLAPPTPQAAAKPGAETILLVEDDPGVREIVIAMLGSQGYSVLAAEQWSDVEPLCEKHTGTIHLLLTDMILPKVSGREVAKRVAAQRPGVKILFMSGYTDDALLHGQGLNGASAFLQKPFTRDQLTAKVREVLDSRVHRKA